MAPQTTSGTKCIAIPLRVDLTDLEPIMQRYDGNDLFRQALKSIKGPHDLFNILCQFIEFNSVFAAGVATLAGKLAISKYIFRDQTDIHAVADRSNEVAAPVFIAAIDEFGRSKTHRSLAEDTLRATSKILDLSQEDVKRLSTSSSSTLSAINKVNQGYCGANKVSESDLFKGIGFHIGSEVLASEEFAILNSYLIEEHPDLANSLRALGAYQWIVVHPQVEQDHFEDGLEAANRGLKYYVDPRMAKKWILQGFANFASVQRRFMLSLLLSVR